MLDLFAEVEGRRHTVTSSLKAEGQQHATQHDSRMTNITNEPIFIAPGFTFARLVCLPGFTPPPPPRRQRLRAEFRDAARRRRALMRATRCYM